MFTKDAKNVHILCDFWARASGMMGGSAAHAPCGAKKKPLLCLFQSSSAPDYLNTR